MTQSVVLALLAAALFGTALVTTHFGLRHTDAWSGARISVPAAAVLFWVGAPFSDWTGMEWSAVAVFAFVGLFFPSAVTLLTFEGNRRLGPSVAGTIGSTAPLFAVLGAALFLGEALGLRELAATAVIVLGSMLLSSQGRRGERSKPARALWLPWSAALLRALAQVVSKAGLALWANPVAAVLAGYTVSAAVVWAAGALRANARFVINRPAAAWFAATGILNGLAVLALYGALNGGPVSLVSPIVATYPLFTLALSAALLRQERITGRLAAGVALTVAGVVLLLIHW